MEQNVILKSNRKYFSSSKKHIIKTKLSLENYKKLNLVFEKAHQLFKIPAMLIFKSFVCEASTIFHYQQLHPQQLFWLLWNLQSTDKKKDNFKTRHFNYNLKILCSVFNRILKLLIRGFLWEGEVFYRYYDCFKPSMHNYIEISSNKMNVKEIKPYQVSVNNKKRKFVSKTSEGFVYQTCKFLKFQTF